MALIGSEILQVQGVDGNGYPAATTQQTTAYGVANTASLGARSTSALTLTNSATLTAVPGMTVNLIKNAVYSFEIYLSVSASAGGGIAINLGQGTVTAATFTADTWIYNTTTTSAQGNTTSLSSNLTTLTGLATAVDITGTVIATNNGSFAVFAAQNVGGNASSTVVNAGSYMALQRLS